MTTVWTRFQFEGVHYYPEAAFPTEYLKHLHRHVFHVEVELYVSHGNRAVEFIGLKMEVRDHCVTSYGGTATTYSCEQMAALIGAFLIHRCYKPCRVSVSEDGENGGTWRPDAA